MRGSSDVPVPGPVFVGVDHETMALVTRQVVGPPPRLDPSQSHVLIIARGRDRPGVISMIAERLYSQDATITTSKMLSLGDDFAIMMHASVTKEKLTDLIECVSGTKESKRLKTTKTGTMQVHCDDGLSLTIRALQPPPLKGETAPALVAKLWLTGQDRPGLLYHLSEAISEQQLNIEHLQTERNEMADAHQLFSVHCHVVSSDCAVPDISKLKARLKQLEKTLNVRCSLEVC